MSFKSGNFAWISVSVYVTARISVLPSFTDEGWLEGDKQPEMTSKNLFSPWYNPFTQLKLTNLSVKNLFFC